MQIIQIGDRSNTEMTIYKFRPNTLKRTIAPMYLKYTLESLESRTNARMGSKINWPTPMPISPDGLIPIKLDLPKHYFRYG